MSTNAVMADPRIEEDEVEDDGEEGKALLTTSFLTDSDTLLRVEECYRLVNIIRKRQLRRRTSFRAAPEELSVLPWNHDELAAMIVRRISKKRIAGMLIEKGRALLDANPEFTGATTIETGTEHSIIISVDRTVWADMKHDATTKAVNIRELATAYLLFSLQLGPSLTNPSTPYRQ